MVDHRVGIRRRRSGMLAALVAATLVVAACGGDDDASPTTTAAPAVTTAPSSDTTVPSPDTTGAPPAPDINRDGEIVIHGHPAVATLDPHRVTSASTILLYAPIYDRLLRQDIDFNLHPMIATEWSFNADGSVMTLKIRDDVTFNDGTPLTAEAVKASLERGRDMEGSTAAPDLKVIGDVTIVDETTIELALTGPAGELPYALAGPAGVVINPAFHQGADLDVSPPAGAGSGPMVLVEFRPQDGADYERADEEYWEPEANNLAKLTVANVPASDVKMNAFRTGVANVISVRPDGYPEAVAVANEPGNVLYDQIPVAWGTLGLLIRNTLSEFDKVEVRQALNYAVNRAEVAFANEDRCLVTNQSFGPTMRGHVPELENTYPPEGDQARARELLESVGLGDGFTFDVQHVAGNQTYGNLALQLQAQLAEVGITMNIHPVESAQVNPQFNAGEWAGWTHVVLGQATPGRLLNFSFLARTNLVGDAVPEIRELAAVGQDVTKTDAERTAAYERISELLVENAIWVPICTLNQTWLAKSNVVGLDTAGHQEGATLDPRYLAVLND